MNTNFDNGRGLKFSFSEKMLCSEYRVESDILHKVFQGTLVDMGASFFVLRLLDGRLALFKYPSKIYASDLTISNLEYSPIIEWDSISNIPFLVFPHIHESRLTNSRQ